MPSSLLAGMLDDLSGSALEAAVAQLLATPDGPALLASHPATPDGALIAIAQKAPIAARKRLLQRGYLPGPVLEQLLTDRSSTIRREAAHLKAEADALDAGTENNPATLTALLAQPTWDTPTVHSIRAALTRTTKGVIHLREDVLVEQLTRTAGEHLIGAGAARCCTTWTDAVRLLGEVTGGFAYVTIAAAVQHAGEHLEQLRKADGVTASSSKYWDRQIIAALPATPPAELASLLRDRDRDVRHQACMNPALPEKQASAAVETGVVDLDAWRDRMTLLGPTAEAEALAALVPAAMMLALCDEDRTDIPDAVYAAAAAGSTALRELAASHPGTPGDVLARLATDPDPEVVNAVVCHPSTPGPAIAAARPTIPNWEAFARVSDDDLMGVHWSIAQIAIDTNTNEYRRFGSSEEDTRQSNRMRRRVADAISAAEENHPGTLRSLTALAPNWDGSVHALITAAQSL